MNYYYIPSATDQGYVEVAEAEFNAMVAKRQQRIYSHKVYCGEIKLENVPEEHRETVRSIVDERVAKYGKYEDKRISSPEALAAVEKIPGSTLTRGEAKTLFADIEKLRSGATDAVASTAVSVFQKLKEDGSLVKAGTRINWNDTLKRAAVDLWDTAENNPDNAPGLWEDTNYRDGYRIIPETITATLAFAHGECGWWGETLYRSKLAANVYTPAQYPDGWEIVNLILKEE